MTVGSRLNNSAIVLEVGSGAGPWPRSDVLVDRFYIDNTGQRGGSEIYQDRRPLIVAAGEHLPFADKTFDYVFCKHVVEHADDISAFLDEMSRVGRGGYLECPAPALERVLNQPQHRWYIANHGGRLLIHPKTNENNITTHDDRMYFHLMSDHLIIRHYWDLFVVALEWTERIHYEMCPELTPVLVQQIPEDQLAARVGHEKIKSLALCLRDAVQEALRKWLRDELLANGVSRTVLNSRRRLRNERRLEAGATRLTMRQLEELLRCPCCRAELATSPEGFDCTRCGRHYPTQSGVPNFLFDGP